MDSFHKNNQLPSLLQQSPISLLPSELFHEIFAPLASRGLFQLSHALFVCKHWHNVIVSDKELWSAIILDEEFVVRFKLRSIWAAEISRAGAYIRACLDRSAPLPFDVTISARFEYNDGTACCLVLDELFNSGEPRHIQRCRSLSWRIGHPFSDIPVISALLPPSLERLEYLFLKGSTFKSNSLVRFPQCPQLKEVHLFNHFDGVSPTYFLDRDHTHVEKLTYTCDTGWMDYDIPYIRWFHAIRTLVLEDAFPDSSSEYDFLEVEDTSIAHLHCLQTLKLIGSIPLEIMQRLHAPILRRVEIAVGNSTPQSHALDTVPLVLLRSVTEMSISICLSDSETPSNPQHLRRVICGAPSLTSLFGTFGVCESLAGEGWFRERNIVYHYL